MNFSIRTPLAVLLFAVTTWTSLACLFAKAPATATEAPEVDHSTITAADIPADAPDFKDYQVGGRQITKKPALDLSDEESRMFRTRLRVWANEPINFAGHYILATWGCGTLCTQLAIIDAHTGKVYHPQGFSTLDATNVDDQLSGGDWYASGALQFKADSRLLVLFGAPQERAEDRGISYLVWDDTHQLKRIRFVAKPY